MALKEKFENVDGDFVKCFHSWIDVTCCLSCGHSIASMTAEAIFSEDIVKEFKISDKRISH